MKKLLIFLFGLLLLACEKEENSIRDPKPRLELLSIGPGTVREFVDSVVVELAYEDGDGDLGGVHPDSSNLFVIDNRIDVPFEFRVQDLVPGGAEVPIKGKLKVVLQNLYLTNNEDQQEVDFDVYAVDRAGNQSNRVTSQKILLVKE